ncbi:histidine kinase [Streptomyces sp. C]|uniref:sensor histidine kinase n=1 Tax=Streptomyces sp. C TaxID=253839 RepID=UPI0001DEF8B4|nr:histidine kinase [Streptomyces sp. C]EFL20094.1 two-component system sensor kinase [Streptomyces sp. C]
MPHFTTALRRGHVRRSPRDLTVDALLFLLAVAYALAIASSSTPAAPEPGLDWTRPEPVAGVLACGLLWLRRSRPVETACALIALSVPFGTAAGAMVAALFTVAVHRAPRTTLIVYAAGLLPAATDPLLRPDPAMPGFQYFVFGTVVQGCAVGWGLFVHHRRQLLLRVASEARLRAEQAQTRAREEVAREMHDVLGHRLSLLALHAGALEYRPDAPAGDVARAAGVIRESAHQALQELREVLTVLRAPETGERPRPTLADVHRLVSESCTAGMRVRLVKDAPPAVPDLVGRTAYRVVQEALTNVRKHAPGAPADVRVTGGAGEGLTVEVTNPPPGTRSAVPGHAPAGQGLAGLAERVALAGGRLEYGPGRDGGWGITARLPWP